MGGENMRPLIDMDTIQIEITNHCVNRCSNCTRLVGHHTSSSLYFMGKYDDGGRIGWKSAIDSMVQYPKMTGIMGGEPLLHPDFEEICDYLHSHISPDRCGLWTCFPLGFSRYREVICRTFGNIFLNDHSRNDVLHGPILVTGRTVRKPDGSPLSAWEGRYFQHHCWVQNSWSASINPGGAWFCEVAAAIGWIRGVRGWGLKWGEHPWWVKSPRNFHDQLDMCDLCGASYPIRRRESTDGRDDVDLWWRDKLRRMGSPKIRDGHYVLHMGETCTDSRPTASYKDVDYRSGIANRYGIFLMNNERGFQTPRLRSKWNGEGGGQIEERKDGEGKEGRQDNE